MKIQNFKFYTAMAVLATGTITSSIAYSNAHINEMKVEFEKDIEKYQEKENQIFQRINDIEVEVEEMQQEIEKTGRKIDLLIAKQEEKKKESDSRKLAEEVSENNNRINSIVIAKQEDGQYLLSFYKVGVQPYDYMVVTDISSTLASIDSSYIDDIEIVFLDGCDNKGILDNLHYFKKLKRLNLDNCTFSNVDSISKLNELEYLRIVDCPNISDISSFKYLSNLRVLILNQTEVENIESLSYLSALEVADLKGNKIVNPCCLENLSRLYVVVLTDNCITNEYYLSGLINHNIISDSDTKEIIIPKTSTETNKRTL